MNWRPGIKRTENLSKKKTPELLEVQTRETDPPEELLEGLDPLLEEVQDLENTIQADCEEILTSQESLKPEIVLKITALLNRLQNETTIFLKNISRELASYPKGVAASFRDNHIHKKSQHYFKKLLGKKFSTYNHLRSQSGENRNEEEIQKAELKANQSFYILYQNAQNLLKTIESEDWGHSKQKIKALSEVQRFLSLMVKQGIKLQRDREIFHLLHVLEKTTRIKGEGQYYALDTAVLESVEYLSKKNPSIQTKERVTADRVDEAFNGDPFLICSYLKKTRR